MLVSGVRKKGTMSAVRTANRVDKALRTTASCKVLIRVNTGCKLFLPHPLLKLLILLAAHEGLTKPRRRRVRNR